MLANNNLLDDDNLGANTGEFNALTLSYYTNEAYWTKFFCTAIFVLLGLSGLLLIWILTALPLQGNIALVIGVVLIAFGFSGWLTSLLFAYSNTLKEFTLTKNTERLEYAMGRRKLFFIVSAVLTGLGILATLAAFARIG